MTWKYECDQSTLQNIDYGGKAITAGCKQTGFTKAVAAQTCKSEDILVCQSSSLPRSRQPFEPGDCRCLASVESEFV